MPQHPLISMEPFMQMLYMNFKSTDQMHAHSIKTKGALMLRHSRTAFHEDHASIKQL